MKDRGEDEIHPTKVRGFNREHGCHLRSHLPKMGELGDSLKRDSSGQSSKLCIPLILSYRRPSHNKYHRTPALYPRSANSPTALPAHYFCIFSLAIARDTMVDTGVCPDCITGAIHGGAPKGTVSTIAKLPTYIAQSTSKPGKPGVIVIIPDVFGWNFINNRLLADEYAERSGRTVYLPDFMFGILFPALRIELIAGDAPSHEPFNIADPVDGSQPSMFQKMYSTVVVRVVNVLAVPGHNFSYL